MNIQNFISSIISWFFAHGIKIIAILIIVILANRIGKILIRKTIRKIIKSLPGSKPSDEETEKKRADTIIKVFNNIFTVIILLIAILAILPEFGINITGLLAGIGVIGLAIGLGAKSLIQDFLAGIFIILEGQYRIGDSVCLDGTCGKVEDITLRKTVLRDEDGVLYHVPNGTIKKVANKSK